MRSKIYMYIKTYSVFITPPPTPLNKQINKLVACQRYSPFSSVMIGTPWINRKKNPSNRNEKSPIIRTIPAF